MRRQEHQFDSTNLGHSRRLIKDIAPAADTTCDIQRLPTSVRLHLLYQSGHLFHHCLMIFLLCQTTHDDHRHNALNTLHLDRHPASIDSIFSCSIAQSILVPKMSLITHHFDMHIVRANAPPQYRLAFSSDPMVIIGLGAASGGGVEEYMIAVGESDVNHDRLFARSSEILADREPKSPGVVCGEVRKDQFCFCSFDCGELWPVRFECAEEEVGSRTRCSSKSKGAMLCAIRTELSLQSQLTVYSALRCQIRIW